MPSRHLIFLLFVFLTGGTGLSAQPNILLIQADDLGWDDLGVHGNPYVETPALDRLAEEGMQFRRFYLNSVCAPTRASLLTGRHFLRTGVSHVHGGKDFVHLDETLLSEALKVNGYRTGMWGKWHSGKTAGYFPWDRGFDEAYMARLYKHENSEGRLNGQPVQHRKWASEVITDYAIDFIRREDERPFFAYLSYLTVHAPLRAPAHLTGKYRKKGLSPNLSTLYGMIQQMDSCIHELLMELDRLGLADNTLVLFLSDNGPAYNGNALTTTDRETRYVSKLKGHKGNLWENGVKSALFVRWPEAVRPSVDQRLVGITDIYPTLVELAGGEFPEGQLPLDGRSLAAYFTDPDAGNDKFVFDYVHLGWADHTRPYTPVGIPGEYDPVDKEAAPPPLAEQLISVRKGSYKLMKNPFPVKGAQFEDYGYILVDIEADPRESINLTDRYPDLFTQMKTALDNWFLTILQEPHAFQAPAFQVDGESGNILGYGARSISERLTNTGFYLSGWEQAGQVATYALNMLEAGEYVLEVHFSELATPLTLIAGFGDQSISGRVAQTGKTSIGKVKLEKGNEKLVLQNVPEEHSGNKGVTKLTQLYLRRLN